MRIAIFGSYHEKSQNFRFRGSINGFKQACRDIGREFAKLSQRVIIGGASERTADYYIVEGMVEAADTFNIKKPLIEVNRPDDNRTYDNPSIFYYSAERYPELFTFHSRIEGWWEGAHLLSIKEANSIITIGGQKSTYLAGLAAIVAGKKLIPLCCFGGSSEKLFQILEKLNGVEDIDKYRQLNGPWTKNSLKLILQLLGFTEGPTLLLIHGRSRDWVELKNWLETGNNASKAKAIVMQQQFGKGQTLPEKFETLASQVEGAIAIATPDDIGHTRSAITDPLLRARQNVWLEIGWFWGRLGRSKLMVLCKNDLEVPTDLQGLELYYYENSPLEKSEQILMFIKSIREGD